MDINWKQKKNRGVHAYWIMAYEEFDFKIKPLADTFIIAAVCLYIRWGEFSKLLRASLCQRIPYIAQPPSNFDIVKVFCYTSYLHAGLHVPWHVFESLQLCAERCERE
jgi:hypothetical protein